MNLDFIPCVPIKMQHFVQNMKQQPFVQLEKYFLIRKGYA